MNNLKYLLATGFATFSLIILGDSFPNYHRRHVGNINRFSNEIVDEDKKKKNIDSDLFDKVKDSLVIINCGESTGSGFICDMDGKKWLITNEHVIHSGGMFEARTHSGQRIYGSVFIQVGANRDLVRMPLNGENVSALKIDDCMPGINDKLYTFGNSDGGKVITSLTGVCQGIGPDTIEVSIPFVQGNSGGAILNEKGNVVGVVTYATKRNEPDNWIKTGSRFNDVRRFGVRLNDVIWEEISWLEFNDRAQGLSTLNDYMDILIPLCFKEGGISLLSKISGEYKSKFVAVPRFSRAIKGIASIDEQAVDCYHKIQILRNEVELLVKSDGRVTTETQRIVNEKIQRIKFLSKDLENKWVKVENCRLNALRLGRDYAIRSDWRLSIFKNEAKVIANDIKFLIDNFKYYNKIDVLR